MLNCFAQSSAGIHGQLLINLSFSLIGFDWFICYQIKVRHRQPTVALGSQTTDYIASFPTLLPAAMYI